MLCTHSTTKSSRSKRSSPVIWKSNNNVTLSLFRTEQHEQKKTLNKLVLCRLSHLCFVDKHFKLGMRKQNNLYQFTWYLRRIKSLFSPKPGSSFAHTWLSLKLGYIQTGRYIASAFVRKLEDTSFLPRWFSHIRSHGFNNSLSIEVKGLTIGAANEG